MEKNALRAQPLLLAVLTLAMMAILFPFWGAILWALIAAILFTPLYERLLARWPKRPSLCAAMMTLGILLIVILPALGVAGAIIDQLVDIYKAAQSQKFDVVAVLGQAEARLPSWSRDLVAQANLPDVAVLKERLSGGAMSMFRGVLGRLLNAGQNAFGLLLSIGMMLYLTFFLLRDGRGLAKAAGGAVPLDPALRGRLADAFVRMVRATIKGGMVVALVQGALGAIAFWILGVPGALLMGVLMGLASLLPAVGTGIIWVPTAAWLLLTGQTWQGIALIIVGVLVIGMVDNLLRPILVGKETGLPDYAILFTTLGGIALIGFNGLVLGPAVAALFIVAWDHASGRTRPLMRAEED